MEYARRGPAKEKALQVVEEAKIEQAKAALELEKTDQGIKDAKAEVHWKETCAEKEQAEAVEASRRVNAPDYRKATTVYVAAEAGHSATVRLLIAARADLDKKTSEVEGGITALCAAARYGRDEACLLLTDAQADPNQRTDDGSTPTMFACLHGHASCLLVLLQAKGDIDLIANDGGTAIEMATRAGHGPIVEILLEQNVQKTMNEWNALGDLALRHGHKAVQKLILRNVECVRGPGRWLDDTEENTVRQVSTKPYLPWPSPHRDPGRTVPFGDVLMGGKPSPPRPNTKLPDVGDDGYPSLCRDLFGNLREEEKEVEVSVWIEYSKEESKKFKKALHAIQTFTKRADDQVEGMQRDVRAGSGGAGFY